MLKKTLLTAVAAGSLAAFAVSPVMAKPGGILVDDDAVCTPDSIEEANIINLPGIVYIWLNVNTSQQGVPNSIFWNLVDNGEVQETGEAVGLCNTTDGDWALYEAVVEGSYTKKNGQPETVTIEAYIDAGQTIHIGNDSFRAD